MVHTACINHCTYQFIPEHEASNVNQYYKHCKTCFPNDETKGACVTCLTVCHDNHELGDLRFGNFFCDCGKEKLCTFGVFKRKSCKTNRTVPCSSSFVSITALGRKRKVTSFQNREKSFSGKKRRRKLVKTEPITVKQTKSNVNEAQEQNDDEEPSDDDTGHESSNQLGEAKERTTNVTPCSLPNTESDESKQESDDSIDSCSEKEDDDKYDRDDEEGNNEYDDEIEVIISSRKTAKSESILFEKETPSHRIQMIEETTGVEFDSTDDGDITTPQSTSSQESAATPLAPRVSKYELVIIDDDDEEDIETLKRNENAVLVNELTDDLQIDDMFILQVSKQFY
jgi:hypothetical protein